MNRLGLENLLSELAPRLEGRGISHVRSPAPDATVLELADPGNESLVISTSRALPLLFLAPGGEAPRGGETPQSLRTLKGGRIRSVRPGAGGPSAVLLLTRRDPVGIESDLALLVELGRRPGLSVARTNAEEPTDEFGRETTRASVSWWRDESRRLHVRIGASPHRNAEESRTFESWNEAARFAFLEHAGTIRDDARRQDVLRSLTRKLKRKRRAVERVRSELERSERAPELRRKGQLLLARKDDFRRGEAKQNLLDYDGVTRVEVEVDPRLGPVENAESLFRRAKKAGRVAERSPARLAQLEKEIAGLEAEIAKTNDASGDELAGLRKRHAEPGRSKSGPRDEERIRFRRYTVSGGWEVLVGKSNRDNDLLTQRVAAPSDLWFHARQAPGSHVVLRRAGRKERPDKRAILEAAAIAAFHSKAGKSSKVAVLYTERRHVRKPRGAKPGLVTVSREDVVLVRPALPEQEDRKDS